jgi:V/A-type H+-transporting ATPase subunit I
LVQGYATVPYADVDPTLVAGLAYVVMFGMMFGDLGHGLLILAAAWLVRSGRFRRLAKIQRIWPFLAGAGVAAAGFGVLYGEFFGPTGLIPVVWLSPLEEPVPLLVAAVAVGALLLAGAYVLGTVNRVREGGWIYALYARSGIAGSLLFLALGMLAAGIYLAADILVVLGVALVSVAAVLAFVGLLAAAGGGAAGAVQAVVELFDLIVRVGSNLVSFARLAAFGLTHAALSAVVWQGTTAVWGPGLAAVAAVVLFLAGNAVALTLEALVAGIQALRLEYYELFSRVFDTEGRPFRPWVLPARGAAPIPNNQEVTT